MSNSFKELAPVPPSVYNCADAVAILNKGLGCYVCTMCPLSSPAATNRDIVDFQETTSAPAFVSFEKDEFHQHVEEKHRSQSHLVCVYCHHVIATERYTQHVDFHLAMKSRPSPNPFQCPYSSECLQSKTVGSSGHATFTSLSELLAHKEVVHHSYQEPLPSSCKTSMEEQIRDRLLCMGLECEECGAMFEVENLFWTHLRTTCITLYHCLFPSCLVKSTDPQHLLEHAKSHNTPDTVAITATQERICSDLWRPQRPTEDSLQCVASTSSFSTGYYACLHCSYTTLARSNFHAHLSYNCLVLHSSSQQYLRHAVSTTLPANSIGGGSVEAVNHIPYLLYSCLHCGSFESTELHLVQEHVHLCHSRMDDDTTSQGTPLVRQERVVVPLVLNAMPTSGLGATRIAGLKSMASTSSLLSLRRSSSFMESTINNSAATTGSAGSRPAPAGKSLSASRTNGYSFLNGDEFIPSPETIALPFFEEAFLNDFQGPIEERDRLVKAMQRFSQYRVNILGRLKHRRIPQCPICTKVFEHGVGDVKRHLLSHHLQVNGDALQFCLKYTRTTTAGVNNNNNTDTPEKSVPPPQPPPPLLPTVTVVTPSQELATPSIITENPVTGESNRLIELPHSPRALRDLLVCEAPEDVVDQIAVKMEQYSQHRVLIVTKEAQRIYHCTECAYNSIHCLADVRKHVMGIHCGIPNRYIRFCLQASRLDRMDFQLFHYEKLMSWVDPKPPLNGGNNTAHNGSVVSSSSTGTVTRRRGHTATVSSPQGSPSTSQDLPILDDGDLDDEDHQQPPPRKRSKRNSRFSYQQDDVMDISLSTESNGFSLKSPPPSPLLEGMQREKIALPFSENVLRILIRRYVKRHPHLYTSANGENTASNCDVNMIVQRMRVYSTYYVVHHYLNNVTQSFACQCGHVFQVARQPGSKNRPATLSDCRRHVLGVHAKLPSEFLTLCCQASRLNRHRNFEIYTDAELLEFSSNTASRTSSGSGVTKKDNPSVKSGSGSGMKSSSMSVSSLKLSSSHSPAGAIPMLRKTEDGLILGESYEEDLGYDGLTNMAHHGVTDVERVISLPFSVTALRTLLKNYLPAEMIPFLEHKMRIYSSYKVLVKKIDGKRYLCCSGCSSSSVYGIGDIRKHILGVHAKVPERYKSACLCCSRLSRDDYTLLAEVHLVNENAMKWKGCPLKPWRELSDMERKTLMQMANINYIDGEESATGGDFGEEVLSENSNGVGGGSTTSGGGLYCAAASQKEPLKLKISRQDVTPPSVSTSSKTSTLMNRFASVSMVDRNGQLLGSGRSLLSSSASLLPSTTPTSHLLVNLGDLPENLENSTSDERTPPLTIISEDDNEPSVSAAGHLKDYAILQTTSATGEDPYQELVPYFMCSHCTDSVGSFSKADVKSHILRHHLGLVAYRCAQCPESPLNYFSNRQQVVAHSKQCHAEMEADLPEHLLLLAYQHVQYKQAAKSIPVRLMTSDGANTKLESAGQNAPLETLTSQDEAALVAAVPSSSSTSHSNSSKHRRKRPPVKSSLVVEEGGTGVSHDNGDVLVVMPKSPPSALI